MFTRHAYASLAAVFAFLLTADLAAQSYPTRPVRLLVTSAAGGTGDTVARTLSSQAEKDLHTTIVCDNRPGASGMMAVETVARSKPDGYTLLHMSAGVVSGAAIRAKPSIDIMTELVPIINLAKSEGYLVLLVPSLGINNVRDFVQAGKKKSLLYGTPGIGNTLHLATETITRRLGISMTHVPYKGLSHALAGALSGEVQVIVAPPIATRSYADSGKLVPIAFTDNKRLAWLPSVPTLEEAGFPGLIISGGWQGWFAPAKTDARVVATLYDAASRALQTEQVRHFLEKGGYTPDGKRTDEFRRQIRADFEQYRSIAKAAQIVAE